jgi:hypothetical protein
MRLEHTGDLLPAGEDKFDGDSAAVIALPRSKSHAGVDRC